MTRDMITHLVGMVPLGRVGQPEEIAGLVSYLAGDASAYMTDADLTIDGGVIL